MTATVVPRVVIITGASDGIGAEMAEQLAREEGAGVALVLAARNAAALEQVASACAAAGAATLVVPTDVGDQAQCAALIAAALARFGRIDTLINNAGRSAQALFEDVTDLAWYEALMRINLWGSVWCTQAALPHLKATRGRIVAVSSLAGLVGVPGRTAYGASKFAMTGFFEALRTEVAGAGVSVTIAYPGVVATRIRYKGYRADGGESGASGLKEDDAMPVAVCAGLIIRAMRARKRDEVMTVKGKLGRVLKLLAPGLIDRMALAALKQEVRPQGGPAQP
jgi:NAD(P)-dependent dehydrogenase (short-subunit alcohol dehydrogenase family)